MIDLKILNDKAFFDYKTIGSLIYQNFNKTLNENKI